MSADRIKDSLTAFVKSVFSSLDFYAFYRAKVVSQSSDNLKLDLQPDDARFAGGLSGIPLRLGIPGATVTVTPGAYVFVGWDGGDPQKPFCMLWEDGASVTALTFKATTVNVGDSAGVQPAVLGNSLATRLGALETAYAAHKHTGVTVGGGSTGTTDTPDASAGSSILSTTVNVK